MINIAQFVVINILLIDSEISIRYAILMENKIFLSYNTQDTAIFF